MTPEKIRQEFNNKVRLYFLEKHPFCQYCGNKTTQIHHLIPVADGGDNRESNLIPLCDKCHSLAHGRIYNKSFTEGMKKAKEEGRIGRTSLTLNQKQQTQFKELYNLYINKKIPRIRIATELGVGKTSLYKYWDSWVKEYISNAA